jgi:Zn ribbon nucleic-acid-binding protein
MSSFRCPACEEAKRLRGERRGELVDITCLACGHRWTHDPWECPRCGGRLVAVRKPLLQKARGTQQSIIGYNTIKACPRCDPEDERDSGWMSAT